MARMRILLSSSPCGYSFEPLTVITRDLEECPHRVFRVHRPLGPFVKREDGIYIAIRAADIEMLATDPRTRQVETELVVSHGVIQGPLFDFAKHSMVLSNGIEHRCRRAPLARAFTPTFLSELRPRIRAIADELIDECMTARSMDLVADYCTAIPARVNALVLGIPAADIPDFTRHVYSLARLFTPAFTSKLAPQLQNSARQLLHYVEDLLDERSHPRNDFLTSFLEALGDPESLSHLEALTQIVTMILGGSDTTRTALAIQVALLLQHREQWQAVCANQALIPGAVLESLRYEPPIGSYARVTLEDLDIDGWVVPRNRILWLSTLAALRDPAIYADPDRFDINRADHPRRHPVFGAGAHHCLGEALAKVQLEEGLAAVATRIPSLRLVGERPPIHGSGGIRTIPELRLSRSVDSWRARRRPRILE